MKWELAADCQASMEALFTNKSVAFKEMLAKETKDCMKLKGYHGYLCNKIKEEFSRISAKDKEQMAVSLLFTSKINCDTAKEVYFPTFVAQIVIYWQF